MHRITYLLIVALLGVLLIPQSSCASGPQVKRDMNTPPLWGICTRVNNAGKMKAAGYSYVEEGVKRFLIPQESDEAFAPKQAEALKAPLKIHARQTRWNVMMPRPHFSGILIFDRSSLSIPKYRSAAR